MTRRYPPMIFADDFVERQDIGWRMEPGRKDPSNPVLAPKYPWDGGTLGMHAAVHKDPIDGLYRAWYISMPKHSYDRQLTYAESEDGVRWVRPELDIYPCDGCEKTNIILGSRMGGWVSQPSVFIRPDAEPERRYEMFCYRDPLYYRWQTPGYGCPDHRIEGLPLPPGHSHHYYGMHRHFSNDGIHWRVEGEPIAGDRKTKEVYGGRPFVSSDSLTVCRLRDGRYVVHNKVELPALPGGYVSYDVGRGICRTIARRESPDGWRWGDTYENIITPDWRDPQDTQFMELMMNEYNDGHIGIATVYHCGEQTIDLQFAGSADGRKWFRPVRRPCVSLEPLGEIGGGMIWPTQQFVIDGDDVHLYYAGLTGLHGNLYDAGNGNLGTRAGALCRATWKLGRMWAVLNFGGHDAPASVTTREVPCGGKTLFINAVTRGAGKVEAELLDADRKPIAGHSRGNCNAFRGDEKCAALTWGDRSKVLPERAQLRIILTDALLYGFEWRR
ncbi:MAG: hypothetical protein V2A58_17520 [Planctomycetota bacterium]